MLSYTLIPNTKMKHRYSNQSCSLSGHTSNHVHPAVGATAASSTDKPTTKCVHACMCVIVCVQLPLPLSASVLPVLPS